MSLQPWNRFFLPWAYAPGVSGAPSPGDRLSFYASGTSTPLDTFGDANLSIPNSNPMVADQQGIFRSQSGEGTTDIFLQNLSYKVMWTDEDGVEKITADPVSPFVPGAVTFGTSVVMNCVVDGNGGVPLTGICGDLYVPFACSLVSNVLQAKEPGDLELDVWAKSFVTNTPPTVTDSIVASAPPTLGSSVGSIDETLVGWTKDIAAGTWLRFNINSIDTITRFTLTLNATRSS